MKLAQFEIDGITIREIDPAQQKPLLEFDQPRDQWEFELCGVSWKARNLTDVREIVSEYQRNPRAFEPVHGVFLEWHSGQLTPVSMFPERERNRRHSSDTAMTFVYSGRPMHDCFNADPDMLLIDCEETQKAAREIAVLMATADKYTNEARRIYNTIERVIKKA